MKICPICRKIVPDISEQCPTCGCSDLVVSNTSESSIIPSKKKRSKKKIVGLIILIAIILATIVYFVFYMNGISFFNENVLLERENCDFRNAKWGDDIDTVKKYSDLEIIDENENTLMSKTNLNGYNAVVIYMFDNNRLYQCAYIFQLNYSNAGQYIPVYNTLKDNLSEKYGTPENDKIVPLERNSLIKAAGEAKALQYGYVAYVANWMLDSTGIILIMDAENFDVELHLIYQDKSHSSSPIDGL